ncbi:MAG: glycosyltransferase [Deltaproteobacteria bacterium]|nr:glycosyltransferase [Deltaproteobacteria bacterium]
MSAVSVVIPTYNRAGPVCRAVTSVLLQDFRDFEILVVDDGSTDHTLERLKAFGPLVKVFVHPENRGVSAARNTGIKASHGTWIAFLDSDDYWLPAKLSAQVDFFRRHHEAVVCQTQERWIRKGRWVNPMRKHLKPSGDIFEPSLKLCLVSPSAVMLRRTLLDEVGLFDESLPACEDYDLWLRVSCRYPVHLIERTLVVKEGGAPDQLSATVEGMDRFRILAMTKLIRSGILNPSQRAETLRELSIKCRIYGNGCIRRGRPEEGRHYLELPGRIASEWRGGSE